MKSPSVFLIGVGPGDPDLITVRGRDCLQSADVVIHDQEVNKLILNQAQPDAEVINVGYMPQVAKEDISHLLVEKVREGKIVARLKWGDPFVFDRGGEEALFLSQNGIRFEIVPGVPIAVGVPAYAGIPVTHPSSGDTLTIVRGHDATGKKMPDVDWKALAHLNGTLLFYASVHQIPDIVKSLITHGCSPNTPAGIVRYGALPTQKTDTGTLADLRDLFWQIHLGSEQIPALLVVGTVVQFRDHLRWFDDRPLFGKRVLVTRPRDQATELLKQLKALGAETLEAPMIKIVPPSDPGPLTTAVTQTTQFDWIVFTSVNAVDAFMEAFLIDGRDIRALVGPRLCAVGTGTAARLSTFKIHVDLVPSEFTAAGILAALQTQGPLENVRVLLPRADIGRTLLRDELRKSGAVVTDVIAYQTKLDEEQNKGESDIYQMLLEGQIDVVTFTSGSAVQNFVKTYGAEKMLDLRRQTIVAVIGPVTAKEALKFDIPVTIQPTTYTIAALVDAIAAHFTSSDQTSADVKSHNE